MDASSSLEEIRKLKQVEETLRQNEERYRIFFDSIPDSVVVLDQKGIIVNCNSSATVLYKRLREELIGRHITDFLAPASVSSLINDFSRIQEGETVDEEIQIVRTDGTIIDVWLKGVPLRGAEGNISGVLSYGRDITARKKAEKELEDSHKFLETVIENIPDTISLKDSEHRLTLVNHAYCNRAGVTKEEVIGKTVLWENDEVLFQTGAGLGTSERTYTDIEGKRHYISVKKAPLIDEGGKITHVLTLSRDITVQKHAEKLLRTADEDWRNSFDSLDDVMLIIDRDYNIENINARGLKLLGKRSEDVIGQKCYKVISGAQGPAEDCPCKKSLETKKVESTDRYEEQFGKFFSIKTAPIFNEKGEIEKFIDLRRDITERKRVEEQVKASLNEKEVLLKEIHHRVKNNMQIITSLLSLQSRYVRDTHDLDIFRDSQNRVKSMALIHEELYKSKDLARIDFAEYVQSLATHLFSLYSVNTAVIKLTMDVQDVLLDINTAIPCGLIVNELISNSLKYAFPDGEGGEILIKLSERTGGNLTLIVSDNGIGLHKDLDFRDTKSLGLQLVNTLVEQLEGTIDLDRTEGTAFTIVFKNPK